MKKKKKYSRYLHFKAYIPFLLLVGFFVSGSILIFYSFVSTGKQLTNIRAETPVCNKVGGCGGYCNPGQNSGCGYGGCREWEYCNSSTYSCTDTTNRGANLPDYSRACGVDRANTLQPPDSQPGTTIIPMEPVSPTNIPAFTPVCDKDGGCGGYCNRVQNSGCGYGGCRHWEYCSADSSSCIDTTNQGANPPDYSIACGVDRANLPRPQVSPTTPSINTPTPFTGLVTITPVCTVRGGCGGYCNLAQNNGCGFGGCRHWEYCNTSTYTCIDTTNHGANQPDYSVACGIDRASATVPTGAVTTYPTSTPPATPTAIPTVPTSATPPVPTVTRPDGEHCTSGTSQYPKGFCTITSTDTADGSGKVFLYCDPRKATNGWVSESDGSSCPRQSASGTRNTACIANGYTIQSPYSCCSGSDLGGICRNAPSTSATPTVLPGTTRSPTPGRVASVSPTSIGAVTPSPSPRSTVTPLLSPSLTVLPSSTPTLTATPTATPTQTPTPSLTPVPTRISSNLIRESFDGKRGVYRYSGNSIVDIQNEIYNKPGLEFVFFLEQDINGAPSVGLISVYSGFGKKEISLAPALVVDDQTVELHSSTAGVH